MSAGADFVVEGTVHLVGFGAEDGGEVVRHFEGEEVRSGEVWGGLGCSVDGDGGANMFAIR